MEEESNVMSDPQQERRQAHAYLDHLPDAQLSAVRSLLETMLDPLSRTLADAPLEDEKISEEEEQAVARSKEWFSHHEGIPFEQVVTDLGFTMEQIRNHRLDEEKDPAA
jgi:hypothetical protein